jgi:hypothetical protein
MAAKSISGLSGVEISRQAMTLRQQKSRAQPFSQDQQTFADDADSR